MPNSLMMQVGGGGGLSQFLAIVVPRRLTSATALVSVEFLYKNCSCFSRLLPVRIYCINYNAILFHLYTFP